MSTNPKKGIGGKIPIILIGAGVILMVVQGLSNPALYFQRIFNKVEAPATFSFDRYETLLKSAVKGKLVDYALLAKNKTVLDDCLNSLAKTSDENMKDEKTRLCFLINCYNLMVLKSWLDAYPQILKEDQSTLKQRYSKASLLIGGKTHSINSFSNEVLMPLVKNWNGYPIFLTCGGTKGYPPLLDHFITTGSFDNDCKQALASYIEDPKNVYYDDLSNTMYISPFFKWYQNVLIKDGQAPHQWVLAHLPNTSQLNAVRENHTLLEGYFKEFDWSINNFQPQPSPSKNP